MLILCEVLRWQATEVAELLETTVASVNSALQRARATLADGNVDHDRSFPAARRRWSGAARPLRGGFEAYDIDALTSLIQEDATQSMPPFDLRLRGRDDIFAWWFGPGIRCRARASSRPSPPMARLRTAVQAGTRRWVRAVGAPGDRDLGRAIGEFTFFLDTKTLFPLFGLPDRLEA